MQLFVQSGSSDAAKAKIQQNAERAEIKICAFLAEHNISFKVMDHMIDMLKSAFPDSKVIIFFYINTFINYVTT